MRERVERRQKAFFSPSLLRTTGSFSDGMGRMGKKRGEPADLPHDLLPTLFCLCFSPLATNKGCYLQRGAHSKKEGKRGKGGNAGSTREEFSNIWPWEGAEDWEFRTQQKKSGSSWANQSWTLLLGCTGGKKKGKLEVNPCLLYFFPSSQSKPPDLSTNGGRRGEKVFLESGKKSGEKDGEGSRLVTSKRVFAATAKQRRGISLRI